ncbi:hypothetical protein O3G_MSEX005517 [Manduca sexta]|uniref:tRNA:m(4)X modification enzyme TRM13 n=1 Tax=Manduca sexta TaxID=7130 RepID=A0A922CJJ4_MANSE|nr:hypothetical protein O3G_MSEX005517 [Manduca sexta]
MTDIIKLENNLNVPQCQYFVVRKKRLCRMTVRPGKQYCGEHEPQPKTVDNKEDKRIPCPNDPKHTCYISKLEKHLSICNARAVDLPPYIVQNINAPSDLDAYPRRLLSQIPVESLMQVIDKVNLLYDKCIKEHITWAPQHPIHTTVLEEFNEPNRTESSLRHLRQVSSLLWLIENEGLVSDNTCYVELGAGKGHLSYYACCAWCSPASKSGVLLVDRASLRHKRDNKLTDKSTQRIRADLAHLALHLVPAVADCVTVLGFAKHLCGIATDYALRCITAEGVLEKAKGIVLATCCHHRCEHAGYIANKQLQDLGINSEDLNAMLGMVSWATCGYGRSREVRKRLEAQKNSEQATEYQTDLDHSEDQADSELNDLSDSKDQSDSLSSKDQNCNLSIEEESTPTDHNDVSNFKAQLTKEYKEQVGRKAKALLDWGRVLYLREKGFEAKLLYYVPTSVSLENVCIVAKKVV